MRAERKADKRDRKQEAIDRYHARQADRATYTDPFHSDSDPAFEEYSAGERAEMGLGDAPQGDTNGSSYSHALDTPHIPYQSTGTKYAGYSAPSKRKWCSHHGRRSVITLRECEIFASTSAYASDLNVDLLLSCTGSNPERKVISAPESYKHLCKYVRSPDAISLPWSDGAAPPVQFNFWIQLLHCLPKSLGIYCVGSHGRTGTALAALLMCDTELTALQAIAKIREVHCRECVETYAQREYLLDLENYLTEERSLCK